MDPKRYFELAATLTHRQGASGRICMNRVSLNFLIDVVAFVLFLAMAATGLVLWWILPPGTNSFLVLWGLSRHQWGAIHAWSSIGVLTALMGHLAMHWRWIVAFVSARVARSSRRVILWGVVIGLSILALFAVFAVLATRSVRVVAPHCQRAMGQLDHPPSSVPESHVTARSETEVSEAVSQ